MWKWILSLPLVVFAPGINGLKTYVPCFRHPVLNRSVAWSLSAILRNQTNFIGCGPPSFCMAGTLLGDSVLCLTWFCWADMCWHQLAVEKSTGPIFVPVLGWVVNPLFKQHLVKELDTFHPPFFFGVFFVSWLLLLFVSSAYDPVDNLTNVQLNLWPCSQFDPQKKVCLALFEADCFWRSLLI